MKKVLTILLTLALCLSLFVVAAAEEDDPIVIGQVFWGLHDSYQHAHQVQTQKYCDELGIEYIPIDGQMKPEVQAAGMEDLIARGVDGIICQAYDQASMELSIQAAQDAGIPVVSFVNVSSGDVLYPSVEMAEEVGQENMFIFGASADEIISLENKGGYNPMEIFNSDQDIRRVLMQLINGYYAPQDPELFRDIYNSLLNTQSSDRADTYFILKDFRSYADAEDKIDKAYRDEKWWARTAMLNTACSGKFSSDRTIEEYVRDIWHLKKVKVELPDA